MRTILLAVRTAAIGVVCGLLLTGCPSGGPVGGMDDGGGDMTEVVVVPDLVFDAQRDAAPDLRDATLPDLVADLSEADLVPPPDLVPPADLVPPPDLVPPDDLVPPVDLVPPPD